MSFRCTNFCGVMSGVGRVFSCDCAVVTEAGPGGDGVASTGLWGEMSSAPVGDGAASSGLCGEMIALLLAPTGLIGTELASLGDGISSTGLVGVISCLLPASVGEHGSEARQIRDAGDSSGLFGEINFAVLSLVAVGLFIGVAACDWTVCMSGEVRARLDGARSHFEDFVSSSSSVRSMTTSDCLRFGVEDHWASLLIFGKRPFCIAVNNTPSNFALLHCFMMNKYD